MTHREAVATNPALEPTRCEGELATFESCADRIFGRGPETIVVVDTLRCQACGGFVAMSQGKARNAYSLQDRMVQELAEHFDAKPLLPAEV